MKIKLIILFIIISVFSFGQITEQIKRNKQSFYQLYGTNLDSAILTVDSIFSSDVPVDLAFAYSAKLLLLNMKGEADLFKNEFFERINQLILKTPDNKENYADLTNIHILLGSIHKINHDFDQALENYIIADDYALKDNNLTQHAKIKGNIISSKIDVQDYTGAIKELREIVQNVEENANAYSFEEHVTILNNNYLNLGVCYAHLWINDNTLNKKKDSAIYYYNLVKSTSKINQQLAIANIQIGTLYNKSKDYTSARRHYIQGIDYFKAADLKYNTFACQYNLAVNDFESGENLLAKKTFLNLIKDQKVVELYDDNYTFSLSFLSKIYLNEAKNDSGMYYLDLFTNMYNKKSDKDKEILSNTYNVLYKKSINDDIKELETKVESEKRQQSYIIIISGIVLVLTLFVLLFQFKKNKEVQQKFEILMQKSEVKTKVLQNVPKSLTNDVNISDDQTEKIIKGLAKIEQKEIYLQSNFNNYEAAKYIGTNSKYLAKTLKQYHAMSFNDYLNELRINYIIRTLKEDQKIRNYTIQALAEMIGYKNGVSFSRIFKTKTGISPFQFIKKL